ncbi:MAG: tetratricopeptide repeat protein, partial [Caldilineaceae bacterium]|nr:tetratricopeptide repeat protein [Caldilineaceae bacterium]
LELSPKHIWVIAQRAQMYGQLGQYDEALSDILEVLEPNKAEDNDDSVLYLALANVETMQGKYSEAAVDYYQWITLNQKRIQAYTISDSNKQVDLPIRLGWVYSIKFNGVSGQRLKIVAKGKENEAIDPILVILDPTNDPVVASDDIVMFEDLDSSIDDYKLPTTGTYTILVSQSVSGISGDVSVSLELK